MSAALDRISIHSSQYNNNIKFDRNGNTIYMCGYNMKLFIHIANIEMQVYLKISDVYQSSGFHGENRIILDPTFLN